MYLKGKILSSWHCSYLLWLKLKVLNLTYKFGRHRESAKWKRQRLGKYEGRVGNSTSQTHGGHKYGEISTGATKGSQSEALAPPAAIVDHNSLLFNTSRGALSPSLLLIPFLYPSFGFLVVWKTTTLWGGMM